MPRISRWWWGEIMGRLDRNWDEIWGESEPDWTAVVDLMFYIIIKMHKHKQNSAPWSKSNENKMVLTSSTAFGNSTCALLWDADSRADDTCTWTSVFMRTHGFLYHLVKWNLNCCWGAHWSRTKYPDPWGGLNTPPYRQGLQITDVPVTPQMQYWLLVDTSIYRCSLNTSHEGNLYAGCRAHYLRPHWGGGGGGGATAAHCIGSLWEF